MMGKTTWFSAMLIFVVVVEGDLDARRQRSLVLFRAEDFQAALVSALAHGRRMEKDYLGGTSLRVQWLLEAVESIDQLDEVLEDGREVFSETGGNVLLSDLDLPLSPESSRPLGTGV